MKEILRQEAREWDRKGEIEDRENYLGNRITIREVVRCHADTCNTNKQGWCVGRFSANFRLQMNHMKILVTCLSFEKKFDHPNITQKGDEIKKFSCSVCGIQLFLPNNPAAHQCHECGNLVCTNHAYQDGGMTLCAPCNFKEEKEQV